MREIADPDVAFRIFEDAKVIVANQPVAAVINGCRLPVCYTFNLADAGVTVDSLCSNYPPIAAAVEKGFIRVPLPSGVKRQARACGLEDAVVKTIEAGTVRDYMQRAVAVFVDCMHGRIGQTVCLVE